MSKKKCHQILYIRIQRHSKIKIVAPLGLEPRHTEPESAVLPLHNRAISVCHNAQIAALFAILSLSHVL